MPSVYFTEEHETFRRALAGFLATAVAPDADSWERDRKIPRSAWKAFGEQGLLGLAYPRDVGGGERSIWHSVVFLEELGRTGYSGLRAAVAVHAYMATHYLADAGSPELKHSYLVPAIRGDKVAALAITEAGAGSDLARLTTTADHDDGVSGSAGTEKAGNGNRGAEFVVSGEKTLVTNGTSADFYVVAARTAPQQSSARRGVTGLSLLVIDAGRAGITTATEEKVGWHASDTATVRFDRVRVPATHLIGRRDSGFYYLMRGFQLERLVAAVLAIGGSDRCLEETIAHVRRRPAFDGTLSNLQAVRHRLADLATKLSAARQLVYHAAWCLDSGDLAVEECSMAKVAATELACELASSCLQLSGALAFMADSPIGRAYRDARAGTMAAGPSEVMRDIIAHLVIDGAGAGRPR